MMFGILGRERVCLLWDAYSIDGTADGGNGDGRRGGYGPNREQGAGSSVAATCDLRAALQQCSRDRRLGGCSGCPAGVESCRGLFTGTRVERVEQPWEGSKLEASLA